MGFVDGLPSETRQIFNYICWGIPCFSLVGCILSFCVLKLPIIKNSIINQLISFLMLAEILNNFNQISGLVQHFSKGSKSDFYFEYMRVCYIQIFFNNLSNYLNLSASAIIAIYSFNALTHAIPPKKLAQFLPFPHEYQALSCLPPSSQPHVARWHSRTFHGFSPRHFPCVLSFHTSVRQALRQSRCQE